MGTMMDNPECEWVRVRLPLWVEAGEDRTQRNGEGGDLSPEDRRSIERHLGSCACCDQHRLGLEKALGALECAAGSLAVSLEAPSLWPALERRMTSHQARGRSRWLRPVHGVGDRRLRAWADFRGERPLRFAWMRDSLEEVLESAGLVELTARDRESLGRRVRRPGWILATGMAAAVLLLSIGLTEAQRRQGTAREIIRANGRPLAGAVVLPMPAEAEGPALADSAEDAGEAPSEVAHVDPIPVPEAPPVAPAPAPKGASPATTTAAAPVAAPPSSPSRWNYDLENGTPMPPHAREVKPVY